MLGIATHVSLTAPYINPLPLGKLGEESQQWYFGYKYKENTASMVAFKSRFPGRAMPTDENGFVDHHEVNRAIDMFLIEKANEFNEQVRGNTKVAKYFLPVTFDSKYKELLNDLPEIPKSRISVQDLTSASINNRLNDK